MRCANNTKIKKQKGKKRFLHVFKTTQDVAYATYLHESEQLNLCDGNEIIWTSRGVPKNVWQDLCLSNEPKLFWEQNIRHQFKTYKRNFALEEQVNFVLSKGL